MRHAFLARRSIPLPQRRSPILFACAKTLGRLRGSPGFCLNSWNDGPPTPPAPLSPYGWRSVELLPHLCDDLFGSGARARFYRRKSVTMGNSFLSSQHRPANPCLTEQGAIATTSNNIANVNTPGYARQRPRYRRNHSSKHWHSHLLAPASNFNKSSVSAMRFLDLRVKPGKPNKRVKLTAFLGWRTANSTTLQPKLAVPVCRRRLPLSSTASLSCPPIPGDVNVRPGGFWTAAQNLSTAFQPRVCKSDHPPARQPI